MQLEFIEKFIISNRKAFDDLEPDPCVWQGLEQLLNQQSKLNMANPSEILKPKMSFNNFNNKAT
jgi:hypothetical protein